MNKDSYQWHHNEGENSFPYIFNSLKQILDNNRNQSLMHLDLGCGNGFLTNKISKFFKETHGFDVSESGIEIAKRNSDQNTKFFQTNLNLENIKEDSYNVVTLIEVIEHVYDPENFLKLIKSKMKKDSKIIISTPFHGYLKNLAISLMNKFDHHFDPLWLHGHIKFFSKKTLLKIMNKNGFRVSKVIYSGRFYPFSKSIIIEAINE